MSIPTYRYQVTGNPAVEQNSDRNSWPRVQLNEEGIIDTLEIDLSTDDHQFKPSATPASASNPRGSSKYRLPVTISISPPRPSLRIEISLDEEDTDIDFAPPVYISFADADFD